MPAESLGVWLGDVEIARLEQGRWPAIRCRYTEAALDTWPLNSPIVSCSLPLQEDPLDALAYCKGLLPEGQALESLAARAKLPVNYTFELLSRYGRDIAGALVIAREQPEEREWGVEPFDSDSLAEAIEELDEHPLGVHDDSELSLAGLQDKLLVVDLGDGQWGRPLHGRPSTHIIKVEDRRFPGMARAEADCLRLAFELGLTSIDCQTQEIAEIPCLVVSRFDRRSVGGEVDRVHQEDLCQALGIDPEDARGRAKYEDAGGPSLRQAAALLDAWAPNARTGLERLLSAATFTVLIGNADAHGKNLALLHPAPDEVELAPLYDTVPTALWPKLRKRAAMAVNGKWELAEISADDLASEAVSWGVAREAAERVIQSTVERMDAALGVVTPEPGLAELVRSGIDRLSDRV